MRKKVYDILEALAHRDLVSDPICKIDEQSSRVRTEIYELRHTFNIKIHTIPNFVGRHSAYFLDDTTNNIERVEFLLRKYKKQNIFSCLQ